MSSVVYAVAAATLAATLVAGVTAKREQPSQKFLDRWEDVPPQIEPVTRAVRTIPIVAAVKPEQPVLEVVPIPEPEPTPRQKVKHKPSDICRGKGRIYTPNGKSWRCRR
jgi:hypothetical protein